MIENRSSKSCAPAGFTCVTVHAVTNPIAIPERTRMIASKQSDNASSWASVPPDETFPMRVGGKVNMGLVGNCVHAPQQWNYREERWAFWTIGRPIGAGLVAKLRWKLRFSGFGSLQKRWVNHPEVICTAPSARPLR